MSKLTALRVKNATTPGKYGDGDGLWLVVTSETARKWILRVQKAGRRRDIGLGSAADVGLLEARTAAEDMRRALRRGADPVAERKKAKVIVPTFRDAAIAVHKEHKPGWRNSKHAAQWLSSLEAYAFPTLGDNPVNEIDSPMVRDTLASIWLTIPETARRVRQRIGTVLDYSHAKGWRDAEAPMRTITRGLPKQPKEKAHHPSLPWQEVPAFVADMPRMAETIRLALEFIILTITRSGETRLARWPEVDLMAKVWVIPATRMKAKREHRVPLVPRAIEILKRMAELRTSDDPEGYVFEGRKRGRPLSDMALTMPLRRASLPFTVHGFRSSFRDWCSEATNTPREIAEACLAHVVSNKVGAAYSRTDHLEKRRAVMSQWATFVAGGNGKVLTMSRMAGKHA